MSSRKIHSISALARTLRYSPIISLGGPVNRARRTVKNTVGTRRRWISIGSRAKRDYALRLAAATRRTTDKAAAASIGERKRIERENVRRSTGAEGKGDETSRAILALDDGTRERACN